MLFQITTERNTLHPESNNRSNCVLHILFCMKDFLISENNSIFFGKENCFTKGVLCFITLSFFIPKEYFKKHIKRDSFLFRFILLF